MDRFTEESYYAACAAAPANECQNCGNSVETLHRVPEFDYMGCDDCLEEALSVIAAEAPRKTVGRETLVKEAA